MARSVAPRNPVLLGIDRRRLSRPRVRRGDQCPRRPRRPIVCVRYGDSSLFRTGEASPGRSRRCRSRRRRPCGSDLRSMALWWLEVPEVTRSSSIEVTGLRRLWQSVWQSSAFRGGWCRFSPLGSVSRASFAPRPSFISRRSLVQVQPPLPPQISHLGFQSLRRVVQWP